VSTSTVFSAPLPALASRLRQVTSSPVREILALTARPGVLSFAGGLPAPELFDHVGLRAAFDRVLAREGARVLQYSITEGNPALREWIAARMTAKGLPSDADQVLITSGSQQALTLITAALLEPGDTVLVERPCYLAALQCFGMAGARVVGVPSDAGGLDPEALPALIRQHRPTLIYLVPTFSNPTGRTLSMARRQRIVEVAARYGVWIVEDDPYGELRYRGQPVPWLATLPDAAERVIVLSTFSKTMAPGLRLGWLRAPEVLRRALVVAKQAADLHTSTVDQAAAAEYLTTADLDAHIRRVRQVYAQRRDAMIAALPATVPDGAEWSDPDGGMFVWVRLPGEVDTAELLPRALAHDVAFVPGAPFYPERPDHATLRLSFITHSPEEIRRGMARLARVLRP